MATKKLRSIKGRVVRITRLDSCGRPVYGLASSIVTSGFITVTIANEMEAGEELVQKNAWGEFCINEKDPGILKYATTTIQFCEVDPDTLDVIGGANPAVVGGDTIGVSFGPDLSVGAFAIEVWTKKAGQDACVDGSTTEWGYFVVPNVRNGMLDGDVTIENGPMNITLTGEGYGASDDWGRTPYLDNPFRVTAGFPTGDMWGMVVTPVQPPAVTAGAAALLNGGAVVPGMTLAANIAVTSQTNPMALTLASLGYVVSPTEVAAWTTGEFFTIGTWQFNWSGTIWEGGPA